MSGTRLFYDQAAAACCYLFEAEGGARRQQLLDYLTAHYRGETPSIEQAFGLPAAELGRRIEAWAKERSAGPR